MSSRGPSSPLDSSPPIFNEDVTSAEGTEAVVRYRRELGVVTLGSLSLFSTTSSRPAYKNEDWPCISFNFLGSWVQR